MTYPAYEKYKESGVPWLGKVPEGWEVKRLKHIVTYNSESLPETTEPEFSIKYVDISSVSLVEGITNTEEYEFEKAPSRARRVVRDGDTIVSTVRTYLKAIAAIRHPEKNLIVSTGFAVIRPRKEVYPDFLGYFLQGEGFIGEVVSKSVGVSYPAINASDLVGIEALLPSLPEQKAIAGFLDARTAEIDALIAKKEELLKLLAEQRTALITHAVTRGLYALPARHTGERRYPDQTEALDSDLRRNDGEASAGSMQYKDSGIDWLGHIPAHWEVKAMRYIAKPIIGLTYSPNDITDEDEGTLVLRSSNIQGGVITFDDNVYVKGEIQEKLRTKVGDILICSRNGSRALIGKNARIDKKSANMSFGAFTTVLRSNHGQFLYWVLNSRLFSYQSGRFLTTTINQLTTSTLNAFEVPFPPNKEQEEIVEFLKKRTSEIDNIVSKVCRAIDRLKEYRTALITNAVTGKIDVRGYASRHTGERRYPDQTEALDSDLRRNDENNHARASS